MGCAASTEVMERHALDEIENRNEFMRNQEKERELRELERQREQRELEKERLEIVKEQEKREQEKALKKAKNLKKYHDNIQNCVNDAKDLSAHFNDAIQFMNKNAIKRRIMYDDIKTLDDLNSVVRRNNLLVHEKNIVILSEYNVIQYALAHIILQSLRCPGKIPSLILTNNSDFTHYKYKEENNWIVFVPLNIMTNNARSTLSWMLELDGIIIKLANGINTNIKGDEMDEIWISFEVSTRLADPPTENIDPPKYDNI